MTTVVHEVCRELPANGEPPAWIQLFGAGVLSAVDGRVFLNDRPEEVVRAFVADSRQLPIDWEHATEVKAPVGEPAPAAGWISQLEVRKGELWAAVDWTENAAAQIRRREYRHVSPAFRMDPKTGRVLKLTSVAITNRPALSLRALASRNDAMSEVEERISRALGVSPESFLRSRDQLARERQERETIARAAAVTLSSPALDPSEVAMCKALGVSVETYARSKAELLARTGRR